MNTDLVAFAHIEKAAGTTVAASLRAAEPLRYAYVRPVSPGTSHVFGRSDLQAYRRWNPALRVIAGHAVKSTSDLADGGDVTYVTLLRSPRERYMSHLRHRLDEGEFTSPADFLADPRFHDLQVRSLISTLHEPRPMSDADVDLAMTMLQRDFTVVGVVEQLDRFLFDLRRATSLRVGVDGRARSNTAAQRNTSVGRRWSTSELEATYATEIEAANRRDAELYDRLLSWMGPPNERDHPERTTLLHRVGGVVGVSLQRGVYDPLSKRRRVKNGRSGDGWY